MHFSARRSCTAMVLELTLEVLLQERAVTIPVPQGKTSSEISCFCYLGHRAGARYGPVECVAAAYCRNIAGISSELLLPVGMNCPQASPICILITVTYRHPNAFGRQGPEVQILSPRPEFPFLIQSPTGFRMALVLACRSPSLRRYSGKISGKESRPL